jgi:hypothetical protein
MHKSMMKREKVIGREKKSTERDQGGDCWIDLPETRSVGVLPAAHRGVYLRW